MKRDDELVDLFRDQRDGLWKFFLSGAGSAEIAEDLLQETFMRLWEHREPLAHDPGYDDVTGMRRWLWRVARNRMIDEIRARQRARAKSADADATAAGIAADENPAEEIHRRRTRKLMRQVVVELPGERSRNCLELWLADRTFTDIARETGMRRAQVRGLLQRAKKDVIRETLRRMEPGGDGQGDQG